MCRCMVQGMGSKVHKPTNYHLHSFPQLLVPLLSHRSAADHWCALLLGVTVTQVDRNKPPLPRPVEALLALRRMSASTKCLCLMLQLYVSATNHVAHLCFTHSSSSCAICMAPAVRYLPSTHRVLNIAESKECKDRRCMLYCSSASN